MKLKPCPFCGSTNLTGPTTGTWYIECSNCHCFGPSIEEYEYTRGEQWEITKTLIEDKWNKRDESSN